jgi:5-methylcytosine-specific restriction endonuclease McrA
MKRVYDWKAIQAYYDAGHGYVDCHKKFGIAHATWKNAIARGDLTVRASAHARDDRRVYDWTAVQAYYDQGFSMRQTQIQFGFCNAAWYKAKLRGEIRPRAGCMPIDELLRRGVSRYNVKWRLIRAGLLPTHCQECGLHEWRGRQLSMHIDHINGIKNDHRLENLRMLCPNCHSQTETYGGRNAKRRRRLQDPGSAL